MFADMLTNVCLRRANSWATVGVCSRVLPTADSTLHDCLQDAAGATTCFIDTR